jgi:predicted RNA binding protein YcfA (HicA-like mRNA interferase family)
VSKCAPGAHSLEKMKVRDVIKLLESSRWVQVRQKGSHRVFKHPTRPLVVTVPGHPGDDVPAGTLKSILKKAEAGKS